MPSDHVRDAGLVRVGFQEVVLPTLGLAHQHGRLEVVLRGCLKRGVGIADQAAVFFQWQHFPVADMFAQETAPSLTGLFMYSFWNRRSPM